MTHRNHPSMAHPDANRDVRALHKVEPGADCSLIEREARILPRHFLILLTDRERAKKKNGGYKKDKNVKEYCEKKLKMSRQGKYMYPLWT